MTISNNGSNIIVVDDTCEFFWKLNLYGIFNGYYFLRTKTAQKGDGETACSRYYVQSDIRNKAKEAFESETEKDFDQALTMLAKF